MGITRLLAVASVLMLAASTASAEARLVAYGASGLRVGDAQLVAKPVEAAAIDRALELVWFTSGGSLQVIDLRVASPKAVVIATKLPTGYGFAVSGVSNVESDPMVRAGFVPELHFGKKPAVADGGYGYQMMDPEMVRDEARAFKKALKKAKVVGAKWLKAQLKRAPIKVAERAAEPRPAVTLPTSENCDDGSCGTATTFGDTPYQLVVTGHTCGDTSCGSGHAIHDPATGRFLNIGEPSGWLTAPNGFGLDGPFQFLGDGATYATGTEVCTIGATHTCVKEEGWSYLGWWKAPDAPVEQPIEVTLGEPSQGELALIGLPAISGDGTAVALPIITEELIPEGTCESGNFDSCSEQDVLCRSYAVRIAPVGHSKGDDIALATICGATTGDTILDQTNRAKLAGPLLQLNDALRMSGYRSLTWAKPKPRKARSSGPEVIDLAGVTLKVSTSGESSAEEGSTGLTVSVKASLGKKAVGKASLTGPRSGDFMQTTVIGAALVYGAKPIAYVGATWSGSGTDNSSSGEDLWIVVPLKTAPKPR